MSRPIEIKILSLVFWLLYPMFIASMLMLQPGMTLDKVMSDYPVISALTLLALPVGIGVYSVRPWGYYTFIAYSVVGVIFMLVQYLSEPIPQHYVMLLGAAALAAGVGLILQRHIAAPYFNPKLRWWERYPRFMVNLKAEFKIDGYSRAGSMLDISQSGCYAKIDTKLAAGDTIYLNLELIDYRITTMAKVIWVNRDQDGSYGLMFTDLDRSKKRELKSMIRYLTESAPSTTEIKDQGVPKAI